MALPPSAIGSALISTPLSIRNFSSPGSTNAGSVVTKLTDVRGGPGRGIPRAGFGLTCRRRHLLPRRRKRHRCRETAAEGLAPAVNRLHVVLARLVLEERVRNGERRFRARHEESDREKIDEQGNRKPQPRSSRRYLRLHRPLRSTRGTASRRRSRGRCGAAAAASLRHCGGHVPGRSNTSTSAASPLRITISPPSVFSASPAARRCSFTMT